MPVEAFATFDAARGKLEKMGVQHQQEVVKNGMVLEILSAEFLASA